MLYFALIDAQTYRPMTKVVHHLGHKVCFYVTIVVQTTINQRLKFLVESLAKSTREFSGLISESPTTTHNYTGKRNAEPRADYLSKVLLHFGHIDARWLMTGEGEPFLPNPTSTETNSATLSKNKNFSRSQVIGSNAGSATQNLTSPPADLTALQRENELLRSQLADKERTIQILLKQQP
jgi:hypothetical protein